MPAVFALLAALGCMPAEADTIDAQALARQLGSPLLELASAVDVAGVEIDLGPATLSVTSGLIVPARLASGPTIEVAFVGRARFRFEPPDGIEAGQLELFTGERSLDVPVQEAVLASADASRVEAWLAAGRPSTEPASLEQAAALYARWVGSPERRNSGVSSGLVSALAGDAAYAGHFAAWLTSSELGTFLFRVDPDAYEPITLSSYEPPELSFRERLEVRRLLRRQHRRQRSLGVEWTDLGAWDLWSSMSWPAGATVGGADFEPRHYEIEATIRRDRLMLDARARLELEVRAAGRRTVRLALMSDLEVQSIADAAGRPLPWLRENEQITVVLAASPPLGSKLTLEVAYRGRAVEWAAGRHHVLSDTSHWYPHAGLLDRATYDVTLRWPARYDVIAPGRLVSEGREGDDRWQRRRLELPAVAYSFALGDYAVERGACRDVALTLAFERHRLPSETERAALMHTVCASLEFFEGAFGPYPLDELTVATVEQRFSQSYLGFITFSAGALSPDRRNWMRSATVSHEVAHQWWGNSIGWVSYRDQWLSESMANYAALLYDVHRYGERSNLLAQMAGGWRESLSQRTVEGRTIESLGPLTLGSRLNSSVSLNAYRPIVYRKGAVVLAMLARAIGEERFMRTLGDLATSHAGRVLTTESFLSEIERSSGLDLEGFARQYVYGTGIPQVHYRYETAPAESGAWILHAEARRLSEPSLRYRIERRSTGRLDVEAERRADPAGVEGTELLVPFEVILAAAETEAVPAELAVERGQWSLTGPEESFEIRTTSPPRGFRLDPAGEVLATFHSELDDPKVYLRQRAADLLSEGRTPEAEAIYQQALRVRSPIAAAGTFQAAMRERRDRTEDLRIGLALVRLYIETDRDVEALALLDDIEAALPEEQQEQFSVERDVLRSRLDVRRGDLTPARRRLKKLLRQADPASGDTWRDLMSQLRLNTERDAIVEGYALMAIATLGIGTAEHSRAVAAARARGVDVSALEEAPL